MTSTMSLTNHDADNAAYSSALWYAWGRADASGATFDPFKFAATYEEMNRAHRRGDTSFLPSVQTCFTDWLAAK